MRKKERECERDIKSEMRKSGMRRKKERKLVERSLPTQEFLGSYLSISKLYLLCMVFSLKSLKKTKINFKKMICPV